MHTLTLRAGQTGRLSFSIAPEGEYSLTGAVRARGERVPLVVEGVDMRIPALPVGLHLIEVRANGRTVLYGGLEVLPSPLAEGDGEAAWAVEVDLSELVASVTVTLSEGPQGPQGEKGEQGEPGPQGDPGPQGETGASAYEAWLAAGNAGSEADFLASLRPTEAEVRGAVQDVLYTVPALSSTPEGSGVSNYLYAQLAAAAVPTGLLQAVTIYTRTGSSNNMDEEERYLGLWEDDGAGGWVRRGASVNAVAQVVGGTCRWVFEGVRLQGRALRLCLLDAPDGEWQTSRAFGSRVSPSSDGSLIRTTGGEIAYIPYLVFDYLEQDVDGAITEAERECLQGLSAVLAADAEGVSLGDAKRPLSLVGSEVSVNGGDVLYLSPSAWYRDDVLYSDGTLYLIMDERATLSLRPQAGGGSFYPLFWKLIPVQGSKECFVAEQTRESGCEFLVRSSGYKEPSLEYASAVLYVEAVQFLPSVTGHRRRLAGCLYIVLDFLHSVEASTTEDDFTTTTTTEGVL